MCPCVSDPDVVDDGGSFALCSLRVPDQVVPGTEHPPAEREVLIGGAGQAQTRVLSHSEGGFNNQSTLANHTIY